MTYVCYYECDYCQRRLADNWWASIEKNVLKEGDLSSDGKGGHICNDCRLKQFSKAIAEVGAKVRRGEV